MTNLKLPGIPTQTAGVFDDGQMFGWAGGGKSLSASLPDGAVSVSSSRKNCMIFRGRWLLLRLKARFGVSSQKKSHVFP